MATDNFTASDNNATARRLAKRFPINGDPFSVWYCPEAEDTPWAINDENGVAMVEVRRREIAIKIANALKNSKIYELAHSTTKEVTDGDVQITAIDGLFDIRALAIAGGALADLGKDEPDADEAFQNIWRVMKKISACASELIHKIDVGITESKTTA